MPNRFDQHEEQEPEDLCKNCNHSSFECRYCDAYEHKIEEQETECYFFSDSRPTKQDIEDERGDYLRQCAKDERAERR